MYCISKEHIYRLNSLIENWDKGYYSKGASRIFDSFPFNREDIHHAHYLRNNGSSHPNA